MATTAVTVYWPRGATEQWQQHEATQYTLLGFRVNARTICVVELVPGALRHDLREQLFTRYVSMYP